MDAVNRLTLLSSWSKDQTLFLLNELQKHPLIYDQAHPSYNIRMKRLAAFQDIVVKIRPLKPHMTPKLIASKIRVLKTQYWKEKKDRKTWLANSKPGQKPYKPKLWCFNKLTFLDKKGMYDKNPPPLLEVEDDNQDAVEESYDNVSDDPPVSFEEVEIDRVDEKDDIESENRQTRSVLHSNCLKLVEYLTKEMKAIKDDKVASISAATQLSPSTFLGLMIEAELSKVTEEIYDEAKWKIMRVLEDTSKKCREWKMHPPQINLPSASEPSSSSTPSYNLGGETQVTFFDNHLFKTPIQIAKTKNIGDTYALAE